MFLRSSLILIALFASGILDAAVFAEGKVPPVDYVKKIKPLLARHCVSCHGPLRQKGGLRLDAGTLIRKGGDSGTAVVASKPQASLLVHTLLGSNDVSRMPVDGKPLKKEEIAIISRWIAEGATSPKNEAIAADPRDHWAFKSPVRPKLLQPKNGSWVRNPIDTFIATEHEKRGLSPQPVAEKSVLLRRVYLDLIGLPPTPKQLRAFLADSSPNAYAKVVDELLKSPQYGERWGRHWMDVWRYSDWYGYKKEIRNSARHIWRWRDWIVESLNKDRPYNEMVADMLAADERAPGDTDRLRATGFLARHYYKFNRNVWLDSVIEHSGKAFLGMTFNCARCHDHMYDPISQKEYYQLRAIFEPYRVRTRPVPGQPDILKDGLAVAYDAKLDVKTYIFERGNDKYPDKEHPVSAGLPEILSSSTAKISAVKLPPVVWYPGFRPEIRDGLLKKAQALVTVREAVLRKMKTPQSIPKLSLKAARRALLSLQARIKADDARYATPPGKNAKALAIAANRAENLAAVDQAEFALAVAERNILKPPVVKRKRKIKKKAKSKPVTPAARVKARDAAKKTLAAAKANLAKTSEKYAPLTPTDLQTSSGRRTAMADWIAGRKNPLTARVAVNHIWMRHFGKPLVSTVFDFGKNGKPPSHPKLLDWLAVEFMESGWSMKKLHRLIVTSKTYQLTSSSKNATALNRESDPDNRYYWRMNSIRMESEVVRDSILHVSGQLDLKAGGPELDQKLGQTTFRRSIYYRHAPEKFMTFLQLFDAASTNECYQRNETVVPQQALALINSTLGLTQSRRLAARLNAEPGTADDVGFVERLFERVLCRRPSPQEMTACRAFLKSQIKLLANPSALTKTTGGPKVALGPAAKPQFRARENLSQVLLNHHEFVTRR